MSRFRRALNFLKVKEVDLVGKNYTWSNNQPQPTLSRIDRAFCSLPWEGLFMNPMLLALSSSASDHCPILLCPFLPPSATPKFRFKSYWTSMSGFSNYVLEAWNREVPIRNDPLMVLHIKLSRVTKALSSWSKALVLQGKLSMAIYKEVIQRLEEAQEHRLLSVRERLLVKHLKGRVLGLAQVDLIKEAGRKHPLFPYNG
jgi:hypothetical protein